MYRGELNWLLGTPKAPGPDMSMPGWFEKYESPPLPNITWLKALTNCASKRVDTGSVMRMRFDTAKSRFQRIGPRTRPNPRVLSANVGYRKAATTASGFWNIFGTPPVLPEP